MLSHLRYIIAGVVAALAPGVYAAEAPTASAHNDATSLQTVDMTEQPAIHLLEEESEPDWTEWTAYDSGTLTQPSYVGPIEFSPTESSITVMRREDRNNEGHAQLKFPGMFGGKINGATYDPIDYVVEMQGTTCYFPTTPTNLPTDMEDGYEFYTVYQRSTTTFSVKQPFNFSIWLLVNSSSGYAVYNNGFVYVSDKYQEPEYELWLSKSIYSSTEASATLNFIPKKVIHKMRYCWTSTVRSYIDDAGILVPYYQAISQGADVVPVKESTGGTIDLPFEGPGAHYLSFVLYDAAGDELTSGVLKCLSNLPDNHTWVDAGTARFYPLEISNQQFYPNVTASFSPQVSFDLYNVKMQRASDAPGLIRLVNPMGKGTPFEGIDKLTCTFSYEYPIQPIVFTFDHSEDHYLVIDISDPQAAYLLDRPLGAIIEGSGSLCTSNEYLAAAGAPYRSLVYDNGVIRDDSFNDFLLRMPDAEAPKATIQSVHPFASDELFKGAVDLTVTPETLAVYIRFVNEGDNTDDPAFGEKVKETCTGSRENLFLNRKLSGLMAVTDDASHADCIAIAGYDYKHELLFCQLQKITINRPDEFTVNAGVAEVEDPVAFTLFNTTLKFTEPVYCLPSHHNVYKTDIYGGEYWQALVDHNSHALSYSSQLGATPLVFSIDGDEAVLHSFSSGISYSGSPIWYCGSQGECPAIGTVQTESDGTKVIRFPEMRTRLNMNYHPSSDMVIRLTPPSAIADVHADGDASPICYDLLGRRVANPAKGVYIMVRGDKVTKELR